MKIRQVKPKKSNSNYRLLFDSVKLGNLITKIHSATIRLGNNLEKSIRSFLKTHSNLTTDLDIKNWFFLDHNVLFKNKIITKKPDFIIVNHPKQIYYIIEVKLGSMFDTKKSDGEVNSLFQIEKSLKKYFLKNNLNYKSKIYFCSFFASNKTQIVNGLKKRLNSDNVLTGQELCRLISINFNEVIEKMGLGSETTYDNLVYLIEELFNIDAVANELQNYFKKINGYKKTN